MLTLLGHIPLTEKDEAVVEDHDEYGNQETCHQITKKMMDIKDGFDILCLGLDHHRSCQSET